MAARDFAAAFTVGVAAPAPAKTTPPQTNDVNAKDVNTPATK
jgi:hypothetical protein